jgi:acetyl-CoA acetyltransferase family protein
VRYQNTVIPIDAAWSSPFMRWQGPAADLNSLDMAQQVTARALKNSGVQWPVEELVLGWTIPQKEAFYGAPTLAARLGFPNVSGPMISQACATSVAAIHAAVASQQGARGGARLVVTTDRTSNGPQLLYPRSTSPGGAPDSEHWVLDSFERDPITGQAMLATAERVAADGGFSKAQLDELTARRYAQYEDALANDRAFQKRWMIPVTVGRGRKVQDIDADHGIRPTTLEGLAALEPVQPDGVVSYGSQTHPADGTAGMVITTAKQARSLGVDGPLGQVLASGFARVDPGTMPKAPVPAAHAALQDAGLDYSDIDVIKTHNPFVVNDLWFAKETGVDAETINPYGCSLIYGHPQGPTGARGIVELLHALAERGGGRGLFVGCAAGDTGAALIVQLD